MEHSLQARPMWPFLHASPPKHHSCVLHSKQYVAPIWFCHCPEGHSLQSHGAELLVRRKLPLGHTSHS